MPPIFISAVFTEGGSVLFEVDDAAGGGGRAYALPRIPFNDDDASIEDALAERLGGALGVRVLEQEFLETIYERESDGSEVKLNNLQLVTAWEGTPAEHSGRRIAWVPAGEIAGLELPADLRSALLAGFGIDAAPLQPGTAAVSPGRLIVVTGPAGAGKSTVAALLAGALPRAALISIDQLSHMAVSGRPVPRWEGGDAVASAVFERLAIINAAAVARNFWRAGYDTVVEGVLETPQELDILLDESETGEAYFVTLMPSREAVHARDLGRPEELQMGPRSLELHEVFGLGREFRGMHLDSTGLSPDETAQLVLAHLDEARVR